MKTMRKMKILEIIQTHDVETQDDLLRLLGESGHNVTQATISRDIKELRLIKVLGSNGHYRYAASQPEVPDLSSKLNNFFAETVFSVNNGQNVVCIKCHSGMAQAVCASLDNMQLEGVVGTLAGEDTIFVLCDDVDRAVNIAGDLRKLYSRTE